MHASHASLTAKHALQTFSENCYTSNPKANNLKVDCMCVTLAGHIPGTLHHSTQPNLT